MSAIASCTPDYTITSNNIDPEVSELRNHLTINFYFNRRPYFRNMNINFDITITVADLKHHEQKY